MNTCEKHGTLCMAKPTSNTHVLHAFENGHTYFLISHWSKIWTDWYTLLFIELCLTVLLSLCSCNLTNHYIHICCHLPHTICIHFSTLNCSRGHILNFAQEYHVISQKVGDLHSPYLILDETLCERLHVTYKSSRQKENQNMNLYNINRNSHGLG